MTRMQSFRWMAVSLLLASVLGGCVKKPPDYAALGADPLYEQATAAYEAEDYGKAIRLYEVFASQYVADERAPEARLRLGRAHMEREDYLTAATHFQQLATDFPASPLNREARYGVCQAYVALSPKPQLDQDYTRAAITHCESVAQYYPGTEEGTRAGEQVVRLRTKLARKTFETGMFYFRRKAFDSALVYFEDVVELFPQTPVAPEALSQLVETYRQIGYVEEADAARERLLRDYPESPQAQAVRT